MIQLGTGFVRKRSIKSNKAFTLLEIIIVVLILGILAAIGFVQYARATEKGRTAEAKTVLSSIRTAQHAYWQQFGAYTSDMDALAIQNVASACAAGGVYYFSYSVNSIAATAARCSVNGKLPAASSSYTINLGYDSGTFGGSNAAYY